MITKTLVQCHGESVLPSGYAVAFARTVTAPASWLMRADQRAIVRIDRRKPDHKFMDVSVSGCRGRT